MRDGERDNGLENLFRNRLEENELAADGNLTGRVMRRLGRREFFRFNPARFNIWYLTVAAAGLTVAGMLLLSQPEQNPEVMPAPPDESVRHQVSVDRPQESAGDAFGDAGAEKAVRDIYDAGAAATVEPVAVQSIERHEALSTPHSAAGVTIRVTRPEEKDGLLASAPVTLAVVEPSVTSGCVPLHVEFRCSACDGYNTSWSFGDGGSSSETSPDYIYDLPGTYRVTLTLTDSRGRKITAETEIQAWGRPVADFEIRQEDISGTGDRVQFVNLSAGAVNYLWEFGDGTFSTLAEPQYRYERPGNYDVTLVALSENGCADSLVISDVFADNGMYIRFPNAFMPNMGGPTGGYYNRLTDQANQVFHPVTSGIASYELRIYSKAGLLVFESNDPEMGWDGYYKGQMCSPGVYLWKVRGTYRNGEPLIMAGDVTLLNY
jgi:hypothetical protein